MSDTHFNNPGYINNKKGSAVTYDTTYGSVAYILDTQETNTGKQLIIKTYKGTTKNLTEYGTLIPEIPYRIFINDPAFYYNFLVPSLNKYSTSFFKFNPIRDDYDIHGDFQNGSTFCVEINILRQSFEIFKGKTYRPYGDTKFNNFNIIADDLQASIIVKKAISTEYDYIYLTVCSQITINNLNYSMPVTLKYKINKTNLSTTNKDIAAESWTYPISDKWISDNPLVKLGKINSELSIPLADPTFSGNMWNYNLIPCGFDNNKLYLVYDGCIADMTYYDINNIFIYSSIGNYIVTEGKYIQVNTLTKVDLDPPGFCLPDKQNTQLMNNYRNVSNRITIESIDDYIAISHDYSINTTLYSNLVFYDYTSLEIKSFNNILSPWNTDILVYNDSLYYLIDNKLIKFPEITSSFLTNIGNMGYSSLDSFINKINNYIGDGYVKFFPFSSKENDTNELIKFLTIIYGDDKSWLPTMIGENNYLSIINSNTIGIHTVSTKNRVFNSSYKLMDVETSKKIKEYENKLVIQQQDGFSDNSYCLIDLKYQDNTTAINSVTNYIPTEMTLGSNSDLSINFWSDPLLGPSYANDTSLHGDDNETTAINLLVNISGCSGIYSVISPLTENSFDINLTPFKNREYKGGIEINSEYRPDMDFTYGGNKVIYESQFNNSRCGYWANCNGKVLVSCYDKEGNSILYGSKKIAEVVPFIWQYNQDGMFQLEMLIKFDFTKSVYGSFSDPAFLADDCELTVIFQDETGHSLVSSEYIFDIDIPDGLGSITSNSITKSISDITFDINRTYDKSNLNYTELMDVTKIIHNIRNIPKDKYENSYNITSNTATPSITISMDALSRGDYVYYKYIPKLNGTRSLGRTISELVTCCTKHKYSISNVEIRFGDGVTFGDDVSTNISDSLYIYSDANNDTCLVKATVDINHEVWNDGSIRDDLADSLVYPLISGIFLLAVDENKDNVYFNSSRIVDVASTSFENYTLDTTKTYPNIELNYGIIKRINDQISDIDYIYPTGILFTPTVSELTSQDITVEIKKSGQYRLYLEVEDEFGQFSTWCITNKNNYYNYPN